MTATRDDTLKLVKKGMDAWTKYWGDEAPDVDMYQAFDENNRTEIRNATVATEMLFNYIEDRRTMLQSKGFKLVEIEKPFAVPLDKDRPELFYIGRLDKVFKYEGRIHIGEHKTTTSYKKDGPFRNDFMDSFSPNSQIDGYLYAGHMIYGDELKSVRIDAALVHKDVHDGFRWIPIERQFQQLAGWVWESRYWVDQIEANRRALHSNELDVKKLEYLPAFPKNTSACTNYGGCPYLDLCKMLANPESTRTFSEYTVDRWKPFDALEFNRAKGNVSGFAIRPTDQLYDNTRLASFRGCARAYYYRHERDLKPPSDRRALLFGGAWHSAMDVIWANMARQ